MKNQQPILSLVPCLTVPPVKELETIILSTDNENNPQIGIPKYMPELVADAKKQFLTQVLEQTEFTPFTATAVPPDRTGDGIVYHRVVRPAEYTGSAKGTWKFAQMIPSMEGGKINDISLDDLVKSMAGPEKKDEYVMAVPSMNILREVLTGGGVSVPDIEDIISHDSYFVRRSWCEENLDWMQIIPYVIFFQRVNGKYRIFLYQRGKGSGESRIAGNYSVGVGGHVNPHDRFMPVHGADVEKSYILDLGPWMAMQRNVVREVSEEVKIFAPQADESMRQVSLDSLPGLEELSSPDLGLCSKLFSRSAFFIDQADSKVEKVHLGMFVGIELPEGYKIVTNEEAIIDIGFQDLTELYAKAVNPQAGEKPIESWSRSMIESCFETIVMANLIHGKESTLWTEPDEHNKIDFTAIANSIPREARWKIGTLSRTLARSLDFYETDVFARV